MVATRSLVTSDSKVNVNVNVNVQEFLSRLRIADVYLKVARANRKETHVW